ncbi:protein phosphatase 2C 27 [Pyrus ussuriensis x Pyrus communis]|uniref:protein-serine/threonine phosphatase n=1 Tax=Pyrus ussuriensis x Pyrus communis TaxID=2448454 RepID=A0A5N5GYL0_9ROSA|nr:protein phosphatase 2C 27 [Pyrus ussuriensis x Pyrus communis]
MCLIDAEQLGQEMGNMENNNNIDSNDNDNEQWSLQVDRTEENLDRETPAVVSSSTQNMLNSFQLESIDEDTVVADRKQSLFNFVPALRSGEWSDIGGRTHMEDTHLCIGDLAKKFGYNLLSEEAISFYGVFDGHGGKDAAHFVRDNLPRVIVEDADFPLELEKVITRSFMETDSAFAKKCSREASLASGTTALTAMIFGRSLLVANAGDCRAVLSRCGVAIEMSKDHRPCCTKERMRVESLGGYIDDGYLNGQLGVTRALGNWHLEGMKDAGERGGPLSAIPELKLTTLSKDDEFLIIGTDGIWDVFTSQNAVDFARRRLQEHNDVKLCCKQIVEEAIKRGATDNLTLVMVSFHLEPPPHVAVERPRFRRSISAEGLQNLKFFLDG